MGSGGRDRVVRGGGVRNRVASGVVWSRVGCGGRVVRGRRWSGGREKGRVFGTGRAWILIGVLFRFCGESVSVHRLGTRWSDRAIRLELLVPWSHDLAVGIIPGVLLPALEEVTVVPLESSGLAVSCERQGEASGAVAPSCIGLPVGGVQATNSSVIIEVPRWKGVPNPLDGVA